MKTDTLRLSYLVHAKMEDHKQRIRNRQLLVYDPLYAWAILCCRYMFLANLFKLSQVILVVIVCKIHHSTAVAMVTSQPLEGCIELQLCYKCCFIQTNLGLVALDLNNDNV